MKLRPASPPVVQLVPALIAKKGKGGTSFRGADQYDQGKPGAVLLQTNLEGLTPRSRAREVAHLRAASKLKRAVDHWSISLDPRRGKLTDDQWRQVGQDFIDQMNYAGCAYTLTRHVDEPQDHIHLTLLRTRADGSTVSDSNDFKRSHEAAARCAAAIGLHPLPPRPESTWAPAPIDAQVGANQRAKRRGTASQNHASIARTFDHIVSKSADLAELESKLLEVDVELQIVLKSGGQVQGLNVRATAADEWLKASNLKSDRYLSWTKVAARLALNLDLRERANAQAEPVAEAARERAEQRVAVRLDRQPESVPQPARAMPPEAANQAKEAAMTDDKLDFLNVPPPPRPADVTLDDAGLSLPPSPSPATATDAMGEALARHKKAEQEEEERAQDRAKLEFLTELRKLSVAQLLDLKSAVPPFLLTAAAVEAMLNFLIRLFSAGLVRRVNTLGQAVSAREQIREHAAEELERRRRSPATVSERKAALSHYAEAIQERAKALGARQSNRTAAAPHRDRAAEAAVLRAQLEAGLDRRQVARRHDTVKTRRAAHEDARAEHRRVRAENDMMPVPSGISGLLITKAQRDAAVAAKAAAVLALKSAAARREAAKEQLQLLLDEIEAAAVAHEQEAAEKAAAVEKAEAFERDALERELRALPEQIREVGAAAQRVQHQERAAALVAEHNRLKTPAELEAVEAERLRQLELANRHRRG